VGIFDMMRVKEPRKLRNKIRKQTAREELTHAVEDIRKSR